MLKKKNPILNQKLQDENRKLEKTLHGRVDGVEQPQSTTQEPLPLVPAPEPMIISDSESDDECSSRAKTNSNGKEMMKIALTRAKPWKCEVCVRFFATNTAFRQHFVDYHNGRKICKRSSYSCDRQRDLIKHQRSHEIKDAKFNPLGQECKLCNVWFGGKGLAMHIRKYHMPNEN